MRTKWKRRLNKAEPVPVYAGRAMVDPPVVFTAEDARRTRARLIDAVRYDAANRDKFGFDWADMKQHDGWKLLGFSSAEEFQRTSRPEGLGMSPLQSLLLTLPRRLSSPTIDKSQLISDLIEELRRLQRDEEMPF